MKVTSLELSKQIYAAFPEWKDTDYAYMFHLDGEISLVAASTALDAELWHLGKFLSFGYDTDYLLEKLPNVELKRIDKNYWTALATYYDGTELPDYKSTNANTPAEALGLLVLELKKVGVKI